MTAIICGNHRVWGVKRARPLHQALGLGPLGECGSGPGKDCVYNYRNCRQGGSGRGAHMALCRGRGRELGAPHSQAKVASAGRAAPRAQ